MTYQELLHYGTEYLKNAQIADHKTDAWLMFSFCANIDRAKYMMKMHETVPDFLKEVYEAFMQKRILGIPLQYLLGTQSFMGMDFFVNADVLIPRADTEILVEHALNMLHEEAEVLDLCTGSGCIAVSMKAFRPDIKMHASDISEKALEIAKLNACYNKTDIRFFKGDLFEALNGTFDMIVSNPPYIKTEEISQLEKHVKDFEPRTALDGGDSGLDFYLRIFEKAESYLKPGGSILVEIGWDQGEQVRQIAEKNGFTDIKIVKDLSGLDRVVIVRRKANAKHF